MLRLLLSLLFPELSVRYLYRVLTLVVRGQRQFDVATVFSYIQPNCGCVPGFCYSKTRHKAVLL